MYGASRPAGHRRKSPNSSVRGVVVDLLAKTASALGRAVLPRVLALILGLPMLGFIADMMGLFGGLMMCWAVLDITPGAFIARVEELVPLSHFWSGLIKAPFFALMIGLIGCFEGLKVEGSAESVGRLTTKSVVESIFMVIVVDALFSVYFAEIGY